jgi:hypothetical protein
MVNRQIVSDAKSPTPQVLFPFLFKEVLEEAKEDFLGDVFGIIRAQAGSD